MNASKVTLSANMMEAMARPGMTRKHRQKLRVQAVKDYIRSKPAGTPITIADLALVAGYRSAGSGSTAINKLVSKGVLAKTKDIDSFKWIWTVPGDVHVSSTTNPAFEMKPDAKPYGIDQDIKPSTEKNPPKGLAGSVQTLYSVENIVANAKQYSWEHNSDSLRGFISTLL